jgi:protein-S-isoprenylcysteine O-methyltransferase Ste14
MTEAVSRASMIPLPPLIYLIALIAGVLLGVFVPLPWLVGLLGEILVAVGWIGILGAAALWFSAIRAMRRVGTTLNPNGTPAHLLTGGAFGVSRNPLYLGNTLLLVGISLITGNVWTLLMAVVAALLTQKLVIEREERVLAQQFGKKYRDYAKRVRRWI